MNRGSPSRKIPSLATGARPAEPSRVSAPWPPYRTTQATQTVDRKRGSTKMSTRPRDTVSFSVRATPRDQNPRSKEKTKNHSSLLRVSPAYRSGSIPRTPPIPLFAARCHQTRVCFCFLHSGSLQPFPERKWFGMECLFFFSKQIERHTQAPLSPGASPPLPRTCSRKQRKVRQKRRCHASILGLRLAGGRVGWGHPTLDG